jgi:anti-anti-sigma factor
MAIDSRLADLPPPALRISSTRDDDKHVIRLTGELDLTTADGVEQELRRVELTDAHVIVVDLRELRFIDSQGVRLLFHAAMRSLQGTNRLVLLRGGTDVQRIFEICDLDGRLPFVDELEVLVRRHPSGELGSLPPASAVDGAVDALVRPADVLPRGSDNGSEQDGALGDDDDVA